METTKREPNDFLRQLRKERGWSQKKVADLLQEMGGVADAALIGKWERGEHLPSPFYQEKLCALYGLTAYQLGFARSAEPRSGSLDQAQPTNIWARREATEDHYQRRSPDAGNDDMITKKRRELLQFLSAAATALVLPLPDLAIDWDRVHRAVEKPSQADQLLLYNLEMLNKHYWSLFQASPNKSAILEGVYGQLKTLMQFVQESHPVSQHRGLCALVSDLSQLVGEIFFDCNQYDFAQACYNFAANAAHEANHYDLWACALVRHAFLPIYDGQYHEALPLLQGAQKLANHGDTTLTTRYWVAAVSSDVQAGLGNLSACQQALDLMDEVRNLKNESHGGWLRFDGSRLLEQRGACFVKLGQSKLAIPVLQEALKSNLTPRRQGMVLTDLGQASLQNGNVEQACGYATQVIEIASQGSGMLRKGIYGLRNRLEVYEGTTAVKELDKQLQLLA